MSSVRRSLSPFTAACMVVANMIGTGVFTSIGFQISGVPAAAPLLLLWVLGGLLSLCGALCYAELVTMLPRSGGEYHLLREAYHPAVGFMAGWVSLIAGFAAPVALAAMAFGRYLVGLGLPVNATHAASALVLLMVGLGLLMPRFYLRFMTGATLLKVLLILAFIVGALCLPNPQPSVHELRWADLSLCWTAPFAISLIYVMYAYEGWNGAAYVAGEIEDPKRSLPRVLVGGTLIVTLLYVGLNAVFLWRAPWEAMKDKPEAALIAAQSIFGQVGGNMMGGLIAFGLISTVATMLYAGSRVNERMGQDLSFMRYLSLTDKAGTPYVALLLVGLLAEGMVLTETFSAVQRYVECLLILSSSLAVAAVIWLRWKRPRLERPFRVPLYPLPPLLFLIMAAHMLRYAALSHPKDLLYGGLTLLLGAGIYCLGKRA